MHATADSSAASHGRMPTLSARLVKALHTPFRLASLHTPFLASLHTPFLASLHTPFRLASASVSLRFGAIEPGRMNRAASSRPHP